MSQCPNGSDPVVKAECEVALQKPRTVNEYVKTLRDSNSVENSDTKLLFKNRHCILCKYERKKISMERNSMENNTNVDLLGLSNRHGLHMLEGDSRVTDFDSGISYAGVRNYHCALCRKKRSHREELR